jgi:hypothetical protein
VYDRAKASGRVNDLKIYIPPPNRALKGTSSWVNFFVGRDSRLGNATATFDPEMKLSSQKNQEDRAAESESTKIRQ